jgi:hypothetical protein
LREVKAPTFLRQTANRWRQGCQLYAPAALYPQVSLFLDSWYSFLLEAESTPGLVRPEGLGQLRKAPPHRDLNPRPSGLQHSALTTTLPRAPPGRYTPGEIALSTRWIGGWVDPRPGIGASEKRKILPLAV